MTPRPFDLGEIHRFVGLGGSALRDPAIQDGAGVIANLFIRDAGNVGGESANQTLLHVGVEVGLELGPVGILATDNEPLPDPFLEVGPQALCNRFEMLQRFLGDAPFCMAALVAVVAVAGGIAREHMDDGSAFAQVIQAKIEHPGALAVDHGDAERGLRSQQSRQRFQLKARLEKNSGGSKTRRQFVLLPEIVRGAGKDRLPPGVAAQVRGQVEHAVQVGVKRSILTARGGALQRLLHHIFGHNGLAAMRTILRSIGLEVKTQGTLPFGFVHLKRGQLTDFVPGHHLELSLNTEI